GGVPGGRLRRPRHEAHRRGGAGREADRHPPGPGARCPGGGAGGAGLKKSAAVLVVLGGAVWLALPPARMGAATSAAPATPPDAAALRKLSARLAPVDLTADLGRLPAGERAALADILRAAKIMDALFLRQVWAGNQTLLLGLAGDGTPLGRERLHAFLQN